MNNISEMKAILYTEEKRTLLKQFLRDKASRVKSSHPLSYGQQALWLLHQNSPESPAYNMAAVTRICSPVDVPTLRSVFKTLITRHPALRSTFSLRDEQPIQIIHGYQEVYFEEIDTSADTEERLNQRVADAYQRPFDLEQGPLLRVSLFTRSRGDHILLMTMHHIVGDGWSIWMLMSELLSLYPAQKTGQVAVLPPLKWQYQDFVKWQAEMLESEQGERLWEYWQKQLSGELPVINLPTDRPRPPVQSYNGASITFTLPAALTQGLKELAQTSGATLYMILLATFQVLLHRYTSQDDILVGSPTMGRSRSEFEGIFGYFVNPIVLRAKLEGNPPFTFFLNQVRQTVSEGLAHQDYPFPLLVKRLQPHRDASRSPLFQVLFALHKPQQDDELSVFLLGASDENLRVNRGGLSLAPFKMAQQEGQFYLTLEMVEAEQSLSGVFSYNTDLFEADTIARMVGHLKSLLEGIVAHPGWHVSDLPLLTETERQQLVEWNDTAVDYPQDQCIHQLFEAQVEKTPDAIAVVFEDQQLSYRALNAKANQVAHYLQHIGVKPEVLVGICLERSLEMVIGLLGILKAGGAYVPLDPAYPAARLAFMLEDAQVPVLLTQSSLKEGLPETTALMLCLDAEASALSQLSTENPSSGVSPENLAYVIYTSGSTGKPKGVMIQHHSIADHCRVVPSYYQLVSSDRVLQFSYLNFDASLEQIFSTLITGARLILRGSQIWTIAEFSHQIFKNGITVVNFPPAYWQQWLKEWVNLPEFVLNNSLKLVIVGGDVMLPEMLHSWQQTPMNSIRLINAYGPTEATITTTTFEITSQFYGKTHPQRIPIGRPLANKTVYILDTYNNPVPIGVLGELHIGGASLARGYLNRSDLTKEKFIPNPFSDEPNSRLYKTGDLARYLPDGNIEYLGRIDNQVKIRGFRIELGEIEAVLAQYPAVREVVSIVREDQPGNKRIVAYSVPQEGSVLTSDELRDFLKAKLPNYMVPSVFVILEALPLTPNGKVNRHALPVPEEVDSPLENDSIMPQTDVERSIAAVWQEVLHIDQMGIHNNFFDLGGHSLLIAQVQSKLQDIFAQEISLVELFEYPTIHALAQHLTQKTQRANLNRAESRRSRQVSMRQQRLIRRKHRSKN